MNAKYSVDKIVSLCKRRGFIFASSDIYGGLASAWDYGPLGVELKKQIQESWWQEMVLKHDNIVGLDSAILMHPRVWHASGHVESFADTMVEDLVTHERFRFDHLSGEQQKSMTSPKGNPLSEAREFNLMFETQIGPVKNSNSAIYLRPETAQGIYVNFKNICNTMRQRLPFGIAQVGKAFRNEIVTKNFIFRTCEFEQMEMQFFVHPSQAEEFFKHWQEKRLAFHKKLGIPQESLRLHPHGPDELAHYAKQATDIQYAFPFGWQELEGIHNRSDYDLRRHTEFSGKDMQYHDPVSQERLFPYIIETSLGLTRAVLMVLCSAYREEGEGNDLRILLSLSPSLAPVQVAVFPLFKKEAQVNYAEKIHHRMKQKFRSFYDMSGAIGRRYRRQDEIGTPFCLTVDFQSLEDDTVTLRFRDSMEQVRVKESTLLGRIEEEIQKSAV